jgi:hypothetical protein
MEWHHCYRYYLLLKMPMWQQLWVWWCHFKVKHKSRILYNNRELFCHAILLLSSTSIYVLMHVGFFSFPLVRYAIMLTVSHFLLYYSLSRRSNNRWFGSGCVCVWCIRSLHLVCFLFLSLAFAYAVPRSLFTFIRNNYKNKRTTTSMTKGRAIERAHSSICILYREERSPRRRRRGDHHTY